MEIPKEIIKAAASSGARSIMLVGGSDTGKTTAAEALIHLLSKGKRTGALDLDMGQSHIGPPSTLAWGSVRNGFKGWERIRVEDFYFTGALSPPGNLLPSLTGARLLMDRALKRCEKLVIDTTGLISEPVGRLYKQYKIDLLRPDIIIGLEREGELGDILAPYAGLKRPLVFRVPVSGAVAKSVIKRTDYRAGVFRQYFKEAASVDIDLDGVPVRFTREHERASLEGRLISFRDGFQIDICLGVIEEADLEKGRLRALTPLPAGTGYRTIVIGKAEAAF